jgi:ABC-type Fe3+/spermidine/putrescine transport system ATPase subunit
VSAAAVAIRNVTKRFGSHQALDDVTVDVLTAESVVILGPSGCGKTTLLRLMAGLEVPDTGEISLAGRRVAEAGRNLVPPYRRQLGFVFQDLALWPHLTVRRNLQFVLESLNMPRAERTRRIHDAVTLVRIGAFTERYPHELSGGEQQRVALARALVGSPRILLLDEPLSSLDAELRAAMRSELARLQRSLALSTVYVTHDREDAAVLADRIIEMRAGRIVAVHENRRPEASA